MRKLLVLVLILLGCSIAYSQTVLEQPKVGMSTAQNVRIERIVLTDTATVLFFHTEARAGDWISIPKETYIQPVGTKEKLSVVVAKGISLSEKFTMPVSGEVSYQLIFPKIDPSVTKIDYGEANDGGTWFIYDIQLKPELFKSIIPEKLTGNWFRSDNAQWEISLFDSVAVYKSQVWKYLLYTEQKGIGKLMLRSGSKNLTLFVKPSGNDACQMGETAARWVNYSHTPDESVIPAANETFKLPLFKSDTAIYCGYIRGFNPRLPQRTGLVAVNNVIEGKQNSILLKISDDGTFSVKIPHTNPQTVFVRLPFSNENIFIEPGKTTFHLIDKGNKSNPNLFMGENARINFDLLQLKNFSSFNYSQMMDKVLDFSPEQYKNYLQELQKNDLSRIDVFAGKHSLSAKAVQIKEIEMIYQYASYCMEYASRIEGAYRTKNKIPTTQREIPFKPIKPDSSYYRFLTNNLVNDQLAILASDYYFFINRLKYLDISRPGMNMSYSIPDFVAAMEQSGILLTAEEKEMAKQMEKTFTPEMKKIQDEFMGKFGNQSMAFYQKYKDKLLPFYKEKEGSVITSAMTEEYLAGQKIVISDQEREFLIATDAFQNDPLVRQNSSVVRKYSKQSQQFRKDHQEFISQFYTEKVNTVRNEKMQKTLGIQPGFATDLMISQDFCRPFSQEMTPVSDEKMKAFRQKITTPFVASYAAQKNNEAKARLAATKNLKGSKANEVPKTAGDKVFDAIVSKYKGKVIYFDFWATWCAPCRSGIEQIKPLKDEMESENVAFVYISAPSSPKATYDNMIPTIKGEHYRVSEDEWNILCGMFKISGIPHYVLVGKDGRVINPALGHYDNARLKSLLMKYIHE
jgi:thiol-disulfide isomerase/thioredoxin